MTITYGERHIQVLDVYNTTIGARGNTSATGRPDRAMPLKSCDRGASIGATYLLHRNQIVPADCRLYHQ
jgi:hypothetical protein